MDVYLECFLVYTVTFLLILPARVVPYDLSISLFHCYQWRIQGVKMASRATLALRVSLRVRKKDRQYFGREFENALSKSKNSAQNDRRRP